MTNFKEIGTKYAEAFINGGCDEVRTDIGESYIRDDLRETLFIDIDDDTIMDNYMEIEDAMRETLEKNGYVKNGTDLFCLTKWNTKG